MELAKAYFGKADADPRNLETPCANGLVWLRRTGRYEFELSFKDEKRYLAAERNLTKIQTSAS